MSNHSSLHSPSSAWLRRLCPGSARACAAVPNEDNEFMREGRLAHEIAESLAVRYEHWNVTAGRYDDEMLRCAKIYAEHIHSIIGNPPLWEDDRLKTEDKLDMPNIHPDCFGTCDAWYYDQTNKQVHIWDFKYGRKAIEVVNNWQMIEYAAGVQWLIKKIYLSDEGGLKNDNDIIRYTEFLMNINFNFHIVQPRAKHEYGIIRSWSIKAIHLSELFDEAMKFEDLADQEDAPFAAGDHCQNCRARFGCEEFAKTAIIAGMTTRAIGNSAIPQTPQEVSNELTYLKEASIVLDTRIKNLTEQAMSSIKQGQSIPGYKIMPTLSRSQWSIPDHVVEELGMMHGCNLIKPKEPITPSQAIAMGMPSDLVSMNCSKEITGEKLVESDDEN